MVAAAAMAGVPLLNGFLSKEMFFAETVFAGAAPWRARSALPVVATLAGMFSVAYSLRFIHGVFFGPPSDATCRARRTSRRAGCACRSSCWCSPAWWSASSRRSRSARCSTSRRAPCSAAQLPAVQPRGLARLHRAARHEPGRAGRRRRALPRCCAAPRSAALARPPLLPPLDGRRIFERALVACSCALARGARARCSARSACSRSCAADRARGAGRGAWPVLRHGARRRATAPLLAGVDPAFALLWVDRRGVRDRRGVAGEVPPPRRADHARRRRARHLPHVRLVLRARSRAHAARGRDRDHRADPARPALAAQAHRRSIDAARTPRARAAARGARPRARGRSPAPAWRRSPTRCMTRPLPRSISPLLPRARAARGRRHATWST